MISTWEKNSLTIRCTVTEDGDPNGPAPAPQDLTGATVTASLLPMKDGAAPVSGIVTMDDASAGKVIVRFAKGDLDFGRRNRTECRLQVDVDLDGEFQTVIEERVLVNGSN
ncbi:hypothetical protein [Fuscibacter oryzae]|uniref:Uncharacterized protein n=1 Tax=Fuscibacter oryzae TaxID=2803939 RepID=A0A8J7MQH1_9RHOB|nr:hypothetical protein [Fuscibacter oryzae]MBL4929340.1 hypothetical protein [Fuscibacter oryzae]